MVRNAQRERPLPPMQPACLEQQRQTADVIGMSVSDPDRVKVGKRKTQISRS